MTIERCNNLEINALSLARGQLTIKPIVTLICGLDEGLALSGRKFGADSERHADQPVRLDEQELTPLTNNVTLFLPGPV